MIFASRLHDSQRKHNLENEQESKECQEPQPKDGESNFGIEDTNIIFIFLTVMPLLITLSTLLLNDSNGTLSYWAPRMFPATVGFLLGGLSFITGTIIRQTNIEMLGLIAGLMIFISGFLLYIASLRFLTLLPQTAIYMSTFEIISPVYLMSFLFTISGSKSTIISTILGFKKTDNNG